MEMQCDVCGKEIGPNEGPASNGDCYSACGSWVICDRCMGSLSISERYYIEGIGPKAGRFL